MLFNQARFYGGAIGVAAVQLFFYDNTQAMHVALAGDLRPYRTIVRELGPLTGPMLARLNEAVTRQAAFVAIIGQFEMMMIGLLVVSPLALLFRRPDA
jgi:DHA2 family multidrug resistance protein